MVNVRWKFLPPIHRELHWESVSKRISKIGLHFCISCDQKSTGSFLLEHSVHASRGVTRSKSQSVADCWWRWLQQQRRDCRRVSVRRRWSYYHRDSPSWLVPPHLASPRRLALLFGDTQCPAAAAAAVAASVVGLVVSITATYARGCVAPFRSTRRSPACSER